jgi:hypothetical protein
MLLSGSVDFSPWNTEKLPDIGTPQTARENRIRSKPPSPIAEDSAGNGSLSPKIQRWSNEYSPIHSLAFLSILEILGTATVISNNINEPGISERYYTTRLVELSLLEHWLDLWWVVFVRAKPPPKLNKAFGQKPVRKDAQPNGEYFSHPNPAPVRETMPANTQSQTPPNLKKPKPVQRGIDALWSLNDQDTALKPSAAQNSFPPARRNSPAGKISPVRNKRRTASVPKNRLMKEQSPSQEEMPDATSKSSQDDNYLPVVMAKDPESRQRVIERRKKALQLDMVITQGQKTHLLCSQKSTMSCFNCIS